MTKTGNFSNHVCFLVDDACPALGSLQASLTGMKLTVHPHHRLPAGMHWPVWELIQEASFVSFCYSPWTYSSASHHHWTSTNVRKQKCQSDTHQWVQYGYQCIPVASKALQKTTVHALRIRAGQWKRAGAGAAVILNPHTRHMCITTSVKERTPEAQCVDQICSLC